MSTSLVRGALASVAIALLAMPALAEGSRTSEYTGRITTTMVDGQPRTSSEGAWTFVSGTGAYADNEGTGIDRFTMTSPTEHGGEWKEDVKSAGR